MPREIVVPSHPEDRFQFEVGWDKERESVQVAISSRNGMHLVDEFYAGVADKVGLVFLELLAQAGRSISDENWDPNNPAHADALDLNSSTLGRMVLDAVTGSDYGIEALWWHPERHQINAMIRLLRKARDAAYGKGE